MEVAKRLLIGRKRKRACAVALFTLSILCSPFSHAVFRLQFVKDLHYGIERSLFSYQVGYARWCNLEAALIEDYFEGHVEPSEVASAGAGEDHIEPALVGSAPAGADFPN